MKIAILAITEGGCQLAHHLAKNLNNAEHLIIANSVAETTGIAWPDYDAFIFIMAAGIVVRTIAPLIIDKRLDPCVVVLDEKGHFSISLLSGHLGGGNDLARRVAAITNGQSVLTTASDTLGLTAIDLWAAEKGLVAEESRTMTRISSLLVNRKRLRIYTDTPLGDLPADLISVDEPSEADVIISCKSNWPRATLPFLRPQTLAVGIGCNRGTSSAQIERAFLEALEQSQLSPFSVKTLASIDLKADEPGLLAFAQLKNLNINFFSKEELNEVIGLPKSEVVFKATGAYGVAEPAAILAACGGRLIVEKIKFQDVTIAIAEERA